MSDVMPLLTTALANFAVVLIIGIVVGVAFNRSSRTFLSRATSAMSGTGVGTYVLVGIAGAFIGFHLGVVLGLLPSPLALYLAALIGAGATVWLWRR